MRKPRNRSDAERLPTVVYLQAADNAFAAHTASQDLINGVVGAKIGNVVVCSPIDGGHATPGIVFHAQVHAAGVLSITCQNVTAAAINLPATHVRCIVLPH